MCGTLTIEIWGIAGVFSLLLLLLFFLVCIFHEGMIDCKHVVDFSMAWLTLVQAFSFYLFFLVAFE